MNKILVTLLILALFSRVAFAENLTAIVNGNPVTIFRNTTTYNNSTSWCGDGICGANEDDTVCPLDCKSSEISTATTYMLYVIVAVSIYIVYTQMYPKRRGRA